MPSQAQWNKLNEYLLQVGVQDDTIAFGVNALERLRNLVPFDQGRVYFLDEEGNVFDEYLLNVSKKVTRAYHEYYAEVGNGWYSATRRAKFEARKLKTAADEGPIAKGMAYSLTPITVVDWSAEPHDTRFFTEYVSQLGLTYSTGFILRDNRGLPRMLACIDRTRPVAFGRDETQLLSIAATHLDNMYRKLFADPPVITSNTIALMAGGAPLTERERQVATLLMQGQSTKAISQLLGISRTTVYKHVSNIHAKLGVSNQVELIARLQESAARGKAQGPTTES